MASSAQRGYTAARNPSLVWHFSQVFGDKTEGEIADADIISAVEFNHDGEYLATGDRGGRVVLFERHQDPCSYEYRFYTEFQSHEAEFDYLKSLEIEEKINQIRWLKRTNMGHFLLTTNDKTIKLWKVLERHAPVDAFPVSNRGRADIPPFRAPSSRRFEPRIESRVKRVYANAHTYHINSISPNSDEETFLSADDLRINVWNLAINDQSFNIVDIKPANMEELTEVITCAEFHPIQCNVFMYSSSKGTIKLGDMRASALCDRHAKQYEEPADIANKSFFSEIISSISDVKFSHDGRYFLSRDYLTVKVWDLHMENKPVQTFKVHEYLRPKLCDLYENDCIFDKYQACWSGDDRNILTGSYNNFFRIFNRESNTDICLEASRELVSPHHPLDPVNVCTGPIRTAGPRDVHIDTLDFGAKIMHSSWHSRRGIIALAATNNLYIFRQ